MILASYKATRPGIPGIYNRIGRRVGHGPYSHSELVFTEFGGISASSSFMDGGVRQKQIGYTSVDAWDFLLLPDRFGAAKAMQWFIEHDGEPYDVIGNLRFGASIIWASDDKHKSFCSEAIGASIGLPDPYKLDPNLLANFLKYLGAVKVERPFP